MAKEIIRVTFNLPKGLVEQVDAYGNEMNINRTSAVSVLLSQALKEKNVMENLSEFIKVYRDEYNNSDKEK